MPVSNDEIKKLLEQNLEYNKAIYEMAQKTRRHLLWMKVFAILRVLIIVVPIVLAIIYLPPYIEKVMQPYENLLQASGQGKNTLDNFSLEDLFNQYQK